MNSALKSKRYTFSYSTEVTVTQYTQMGDEDMAQEAKAQVTRHLAFTTNKVEEVYE